jgi:4a-hydroxytetrahydrobiopterin dehydratase
MHTALISTGRDEPIEADEAKRLLAGMAGWKYIKGTIRKDYTFQSFKDAIAFVNKVAEIAETNGHHPDIFIWYKIVTLSLTTHKIGGLSEKDLALAKKIDA